MAKLTLKDPPSNERGGPIRTQNRYTPPKAPSFFESVLDIVKRLAGLALLVIVAMVVFLIVPFRAMDQVSISKDLHAALMELSGQPDSRDALIRLFNAAQADRVIWDQPSGPRPVNRFQNLQRQAYDMRYGIVQTLAMGLFKEGNQKKGLQELNRLRARTGTDSLPGFPDTRSIQQSCPDCTKGVIEKACEFCSGRGWLMVPDESSSFPLQATLRDTRRLRKVEVDKNAHIRQNCPKCNAQGKSIVSCPTCQGATTIIQAGNVINLYADSLNATIRILRQNQSLKRFIRLMAAAQRRVMGEGQKILNESKPLQNFAQASGLLFPETEIPRAGVGHADCPSPSDQRTQERSADPLLLDLQEACETILTEQKHDHDILRILAKAAQSTQMNPAVQNCAMSAFGLSLLLNGKTNQYCRVAEIQKAKFNGTQPLLSIHEDDYLVDCPSCGGKGKKLTPCPACTGPNTCSVCKGTGNMKAGEGFVPCEACRRRPPCTMCKGTKKVMAVCPECCGTKKMFKVSDKIKSVYMFTLSNMLALCSAEIVSEPEGLLTDEKIKPADGLDESTGAATAAKADATDVYAGEDHGALPNVPISGAGYKMRYVLMLAGAVVMMLLVIRFRRTSRKLRGSSLPGMRRLNPSEFTDPLKLTAQDSLDRAKNQTVSRACPGSVSSEKQV